MLYLIFSIHILCSSTPDKHTTVWSKSYILIMFCMSWIKASSKRNVFHLEIMHPLDYVLRWQTQAMNLTTMNGWFNFLLKVYMQPRLKRRYCCDAVINKQAISVCGFKGPRDLNITSTSTSQTCTNTIEQIHRDLIEFYCTRKTSSYVSRELSNNKRQYNAHCTSQYTLQYTMEWNECLVDVVETEISPSFTVTTTIKERWAVQ